MRETLHIRLPGHAPSGDAAATDDTVVAYALTTTEPPVSVLVREAPLSDVLANAAGKVLRLYAPAQDIRLLTAAVPARQASKALLAVPYALEDQFAEDVETLHFAIAGAPGERGEWPVAVVAAQHLRDWLAPFNTRGLVPEAVIPETLALPWRDDDPRWTVLAEPGHMTVRAGTTAGFGCLSEDFELFLGLAEGESKKPLRIFVTQGVDEDFTRLERDIELLPGLSHPLEAFARHYRPQQSINLLQGAFAMRRASAREWQAWRLPVGLLAAAFALAVIGNGVSALLLGKAAERQATANKERFLALFPNQRVVEGRLGEQAEQELKVATGGAGGTSLLPLIDAFSGGLKAAPTLQVQGMQYREGALYLSLTGSDLTALDQLKTHFAAGRGARLEVQSANSGDGGVQIRVRLSPA